MKQVSVNYAADILNESELVAHRTPWYTNELEIPIQESDPSGLPGKNKAKRVKHVEPFLISAWPLAFQTPFNELFSKVFPQYAGNSNGSVALTGSMHYDNVFYNHLETIRSTDQLPDILVTTDINCLYRRNFQQQFLHTDHFETLDVPMHSIYAQTKFEHPRGLFGMLASDALVMVVRKSKYLNSPMPREWYELLHPALRNSITLCGDRDYFFNTFYYQFIKSYGFDAVKQLARNTLERIHPEAMIKAIHSGTKDETAVYVMPYSYARNMTNKLEYQVIWPGDGAILLPIQMLVKKGTFEKHKEMIHFLTGEVLGLEFEKAGFLSTNPNTPKRYPGKSLNWIGWEFLENSDLSGIEGTIRKCLK